MNSIKKAEAPVQGNTSPITTDADANRKRSRKAAIEQHCKNCIYSPGDGPWRKQVAECTSKTCALFSFRPTPARTTPEARTAPVASEKGDFRCNMGGE
jgi:hypothetical protein